MRLGRMAVSALQAYRRGRRQQQDPNDTPTPTRNTSRKRARTGGRSEAVRNDASRSSRAALPGREAEGERRAEAILRNEPGAAERADVAMIEMNRERTEPAALELTV